MSDLLGGFTNPQGINAISLPGIGPGTILGAGEINFVWVWALLLLPLPLLVRLLPAIRYSGGRALQVPADFNIEALSATSSGKRRGNSLFWLALLCWLLLVLAAARPTWLGETVASPVSGRDLMMCIDISGSMNESDLYSGGQPYSRIDVVRKVASDFIKRREGDRIGLIMFGSQAYVQTPLTFDHRTVAHFMEEAQVGLAGRSTAIGDAIGLGIKRLRDRPQESRVLVLLTDGSNSAGVVEPLEAARIAAESGIRIHSIGVGSDDAGSILNFPVRVRRSELDEKTLIQISEITGGKYFRARDVNELQKIYQELDKLEPTDSEVNQFRPQRELFPWPLGLSLLLSFIVAFLWGRRV